MIAIVGAEPSHGVVELQGGAQASLHVGVMHSYNNPPRALGGHMHPKGPAYWMQPNVHEQLKSAAHAANASQHSCFAHSMQGTSKGAGMHAGSRPPVVGSVVLPASVPTPRSGALEVVSAGPVVAFVVASVSVGIAVLDPVVVAAPPSPAVAPIDAVG